MQGEIFIGLAARLRSGPNGGHGGGIKVLAGLSFCPIWLSARPWSFESARIGGAAAST